MYGISLYIRYSSIPTKTLVEILGADSCSFFLRGFSFFLFQLSRVMTKYPRFVAHIAAQLLLCLLLYTTAVCACAHCL